MSENLNPQREQMAHESMVRTLRAQAEAIWPGESEFLRGYALAPGARVLDVGCGTGEFVRRLGEFLPASRLIGVDVIESHLDVARTNCASLGERAEFRSGDAFALEFDDDRFDLVVNRHMLQSIPRPETVVAELLRVTRPGGRLHLLAEDYAMIHFHPVEGDTDRFWHAGPIPFGRAVGTDLRIGRRMFTILKRLGLDRIDVRYVVVDTLRVPRETFIRIWEAWRDGYAEPIAKHTDLTRDEVDGYWEAMISCLRNPEGYAVWHVPVITGVKPER
jgi:SAM-dependent methyltransferase